MMIIIFPYDVFDVFDVGAEVNIRPPLTHTHVTARLYLRVFVTEKRSSTLSFVHCVIDHRSSVQCAGTAQEKIRPKR